MSSVLAAGALVLGCGEQRGGAVGDVAITCFLGWYGTLPYEGPSLQAQTCWNTKCSGTIEPTVITITPSTPERAWAGATEAEAVTPQKDIIEECDRPFIEGSETRPPCGVPGEEDPTALKFPGGVGPGCGFDEQQTDFPVKACATASTATPGSTSVSILIWPEQYAPGRGQDLLRDGDQLTLHLEGPEGVLLEQTVTIDQYEVFSTGGLSCRSAGFDLDGQRL
jgi:hypothetical protein